MTPPQAIRVGIGGRASVNVTFTAEEIAGVNAAALGSGEAVTTWCRGVILQAARDAVGE